MKTFKLFFGITLLSFLTSNAQITKGNWMVGVMPVFQTKKYIIKTLVTIKEEQLKLKLQQMLAILLLKNFKEVPELAMNISPEKEMKWEYQI